MAKRVQLPLMNFSRDSRLGSIIGAVVLSVFAFVALGAITVMLQDAAVSDASKLSASMQTSRIEEEIEQIRRQRTAHEPETGAINALRKRITALNALDFGGSLSVTRLLATLEKLVPPRVALYALDYDRDKGVLDLVAISESSEDLTTLFDLANRNPFFQDVRLVDKKQAGVGTTGAPLIQVRLTIRLARTEPRA